MTNTEWITVSAIILGPILAVIISVLIGFKISDYRSRRDQKFLILSTIVAFQWKIVSEEQVKALNAIDLFYHDVPKVRNKWKEYFEALALKGLSDAEKTKLWDTKRLELIHEMASHLGYSKTISQLDFDRIYSPVGLMGGQLDNPEIIDDLIKVLQDKKESLPIQKTESDSKIEE